MRLTVGGYKVWIDCLRLLGGEPYPKEIDDALRDRTHRVIAVISEHSLRKDNPRKERQQALNIARDRQISDFLIPLNADGSPPVDLGWTIGDLTYIDFQEWAKGLDSLLRKLRSIDTPCAVTDGGQIVRSLCESHDVLSEKVETLHSNIVRFVEVPQSVHIFDLSRPLTVLEKADLATKWACYIKVPTTTTAKPQAIAFEHPPDLGFPDLRVTLRDAVRASDPEIAGLPTWQLVKPLLRKALTLKCLSLGLLVSEHGDFVYFPERLVVDDKLWFVGYDGKRNYIKAVGSRRFRTGDHFFYHLGFTFDVLRLATPDIVAKFRIRLRLTDETKTLLPYPSAVPRRKAITRTWWNRQFLNRIHAVLAFFSGGSDTIVAGGDQSVVLSSELLAFEVPFGIDESKLPKGKRPFRPKKSAKGPK